MTRIFYLSIIVTGFYNYSVVKVSQSPPVYLANQYGIHTDGLNAKTVNVAYRFKSNYGKNWRI